MMLILHDKLSDEGIHELNTKVIIHELEYKFPSSENRKMVKAASNFARKMSERNQSVEHYERNRAAFNPRSNISLGKYGEFVYYIFKSVKFPDLELDFEVREGGQKGWMCDLPFNEKNSKYPNFHVKTCDDNTRSFVKRHRNDEYSWTFQYSNLKGNGGRDCLFDDPKISNELIAFVYVPHVGAGKVRLVATAPWYSIKGILSDPISNRLKGLKLCIYYKDLIKLAEVDKND